MIPVPDFHVGGTCRFEFVLKKPSDGVTPVAANSTPTIVVVKNGVDTVESATVVGTGNTGGYKVSYTPGSSAEGDFFAFRVTANITDAAFNSGSAFNHVETFCCRVKAVERGSDTAPDNAGIASAAASAASAASSASSADTKASGIKTATDQLQFEGGRIIAKAESVTGNVTLAASQPNYAPAKAGDAMTLTSGERTAIANEVETQIIDETDSEKVLNAITAKIAAANPDLSGLTLSSIAAAVKSTIQSYLDKIDRPISETATQTSVDAVDDYVDQEIQTILNRVPGLVRMKSEDETAETAQTTAIRSGLALSTELQTAATAALNAYDPPTNTEMEARTLPTASYATSANQLTLLARIGNFTGSGVNTILGFLKALMSKAAPNPSDVGGSFDAATDSVEALRDRGDAAWAGSGGTDAAEVANQIRARLAGVQVRMINAYQQAQGRLDINVGDAKTLAFGNAWSFSLDSTADLSEATVKIVAQHCETLEQWSIDGTISGNEDDGYTLVFEVHSADSQSLRTGEWKWQLKVVLGDDQHTVNPKGDILWVHPFAST